MKKLILTTVFVAVLGALSIAQTVQKTYHFDNPAVSVVGGYDVISFDGTIGLGEVGKATLPGQHVSLLLPPNTEANEIAVEYSDFVELEGTFNLLPYQQARPLSSTEPLVLERNEEFYGSEAVYPEKTYSKVSTQFMNGCSFAFAQFTPVRYVPASGKVSYAKTVTVTVDVKASRADKSRLLWMTPEVQARVERMAQNPEAVAEYKTRGRSIGGYELLVITPQEWVSHFDEYVAFYEARGLRTHVTALEDILNSFEGRDDAEKVFNYTKQEYEDNGIMMMLLGGDAGLVPWRALYCYVSDEYIDNLPADMYFGCFDTNWDEDNNGLWGEVGEDDLMPEVGVGRMPFNNETQFNNMMHKTLEYQSNPVLGEFNTVILGAEHMGDGYYGSSDIERLIGVNSDFGYTTVGIPEDYEFVKIYENGPTGWSGAIFRNAINEHGGQYVFHCGHANTDYVAGWYVNSTNDASFGQLNGVTHNYGFFNSHGCICGDFTHTCMLERLVNISTGFVATTGNSRYGWYQPWGDGMAAHLNREFVDAYYNDRLPYIGTAFVEMKIMTAPYVATPWGDDGAMRWNLYDINILGDVAVCPWLDEPFRPELSYESAINLGSAATTVEVRKDGVAQSNFRCSIFHNGQLLAFGMTDENGMANVEFGSPLDVADTMQLIITGPNAIPQTIDIIGLSDNTAFVYPQDIELNDDFATGNSLDMDVNFKNAGTADAAGVTASLSTVSQYVSLSKSTVEVGTINAGSSVLVEDAFDFDVAANIPDGTLVDFVMACTDGNSVWNRNLFFKAKAPSLKINNIEYTEIEGNMNGYLEPGETFLFTITGKNVGHLIASNPYIHGSADNQAAQFNTNDLPLNDVAAGGDFEAELQVTIDENTPQGTTIVFSFNVMAGEYSATSDIVLCVGLITEDFETGDLSKLPWVLWGDAEWFVTSDQAYSGSFSAQCGEIGKNQMTSLIVEINTTTDGELSFYYKTLTKYKKDYLILYMDNTVLGFWTGDNDWTLATYTIEAGTHVLEWRYDTSSSGATDGNVCWIDDITFPGNTIVLDDTEEVAFSEMAVYPNPTADVIFIKADDVKCVEVYNSLGVRVIANDVNNSQSVDLTGLAAGMYFVRTIDSKGNINSTKVIKK